MKKIISAVFVTVIVAIAISGFFIPDSKVVQTNSSTERFQLHGEYKGDGNSGPRAVSVVALCDTGNGTMLYLTNYGMSSVPNGCVKSNTSSGIE